MPGKGSEGHRWVVVFLHGTDVIMYVCESSHNGNTVDFCRPPRGIAPPFQQNTAEVLRS